MKAERKEAIRPAAACVRRLAQLMDATAAIGAAAQLVTDDLVNVEEALERWAQEFRQIVGDYSPSPVVLVLS